ncbi:MAG: Mov34/MPN/PAD-1 family protein [Candidatus Diapherotrites archaeon]
MSFFIKKNVLNSLLLAAKNVYPNEFFALLGGSSNVIDEFVVVPAIFGHDFSEFDVNSVPFDNKIIGTVHSHPDYVVRPSSQDLIVFSKFGFVHIILGFPYNFNSFKAFNGNGKIIDLKVID